MSLIEEFGVRVGVTVHMISANRGAEGSVTYTFGVGKMPTKSDVDDAICEALQTFNEQLGVTDARITHLGDQGFARELSIEWAFDKAGAP